MGKEPPKGDGVECPFDVKRGEGYRLLFVLEGVLYLDEAEDQICG